jgi:hypothetical protein
MRIVPQSINRINSIIYVRIRRLIFLEVTVDLICVYPRLSAAILEG